MQCHKAFSRSDHLNKHIKTHNKDKTETKRKPRVVRKPKAISGNKENVNATNFFNQLTTQEPIKTEELIPNEASPVIVPDQHHQYSQMYGHHQHHFQTPQYNAYQGYYNSQQF